jgi:hypothetical protein
MICERRIAGENGQEIGDALGVTRERIRQVVVKWQVAGLIVPGAREPSEAGRKMIAARAPTGRPPGRPRKTVKDEAWWSAKIDEVFKADGRAVSR